MQSLWIKIDCAVFHQTFLHYNKFRPKAHKYVSIDRSKFHGERTCIKNIHTSLSIFRFVLLWYIFFPAPALLSLYIYNLDGIRFISPCAFVYYLATSQRSQRIWKTRMKDGRRVYTSGGREREGGRETDFDSLLSLSLSLWRVHSLRSSARRWSVSGMKCGFRVAISLSRCEIEITLFQLLRGALLHWIPRAYNVIYQFARRREQRALWCP